jgi:cell division protein FtsZ
MDLSIGEFQEVGSIVKQFASEDATVVVGTVIDPEMSDELRVTVVATGLNRSAQQHGRNRGEGFAPASYREPVREAATQRGEMAGRVPPRRQATPSLATVPAAAADYTGFDKPAVQRYARAVGDGMGSGAVDEELLDIPAFLRRQAD